MNFKHFCILAATMCAAYGCDGKKSLTVTVGNSLDFDRENETVEIPLSSIGGKLTGANLYVTESNGNEIPSQITSDSMLIFRASVPAGGEAVYRIYADDKTHSYDTVACGRVHPEREDDLAWENDLAGFRAYGPSIQRKGERLFGYDIFFKHPNLTPVLDTLYGAQCSHENWRKVDSLRRIDPQAAKDFENSFTYHRDHGLGMDCYAVGPTLGAGASAIVVDGKMAMPWCYDSVAVTDNGPIRFRAEMYFAPRAAGSDSAVTETRTIILDAGTMLNRCIVTYGGISADSITVATGFPRRDDYSALLDSNGMLAYGAPTQGDDNGRALLGIVAPAFDSVAEAEGHVLGYRTIPAGAPFEYRWGFAWDRGPVGDFDSWTKALDYSRRAAAAPLTVAVSE